MPKTLKKQQIRDREERILGIARQQVLSQGYHGLNMDRIAEQIGVSKGTIYNHFRCKEEIIIALAVQNMEKRVELFRTAAEFRGTSRQRMFAVARANSFFFQTYPDYFRFEQMLRIDSIWEKTSEKRQFLIRSCEMRCMTMVSGIVRDAVASGDLELPGGTTPEDIVFGLWAISLGAQSIISSSESLAELGVRAPTVTLMDQIQRLLDSFGWQPLSANEDYSVLDEQITRELSKAAERTVE